MIILQGGSIGIATDFAMEGSTFEKMLYDNAKSYKPLFKAY